MTASRYSIKDLEKLSGVKAHTIRIWEQRYRLLSPQRTDTNIRYYSDKDLRKLLNISLLISTGMKISNVAELSEQALTNAVKKTAGNKAANEFEVNELIKASLGLNERDFEKVFSSAVLHGGLRNAVVTIIYPFLEKLGILWGTGEIIPAQEHFASQLIKQKLFTAIDGKPVNDKSSSRVMLFLPEGELHEIPLLLSNFILRDKKINTIYLGPSVPRENILKIARTYKPTHLLLFFITRIDPDVVSAYMQKLTRDFPSQKILLGGTLENIKGSFISKKIHPLTEPSALEQHF